MASLKCHDFVRDAGGSARPGLQRRHYGQADKLASLGALATAELGLRGPRLDTDTGPMVRDPWYHHAHQPSAVAAPVDLTDFLCRHANTSTASRHTNGTRRPAIQSDLLRFIEISTDRG